MNARIALDAMGGDFAPKETVAGALLAAKELAAEVILVGDEKLVGTQLAGQTHPANLRVVHAPDVIGMDAHATEAVRALPGASINVAVGLVKSGEADAFVTMGNTGAAMAAALLTLGRIRGIARPALATVFPSGERGRTMLLDVGANAECRPIHLVQFAHMGAAYMRGMYAIANPRVGLVSIGEEDTKGNDLVVEVNQLLRQQSALNFIGNIEGKDIPTGICDVAVADGFSGNLVLKTAEGVGELMFKELRRAVEAKPWTRLAGLVLLPELRKVRRRLDYSEYGGAQLLGVDGVTVIGHGRSNARAVFNAVRAAREAVANDVIEKLRKVATDIPARGRTSEGGED